MKLREKLGALVAASVAVCAALAAPVSTDSTEAFGNPRIVVHVAGTQAGTVEFQNVESFLPELLFNNDTGELVMPTNYCGLRITHVGGIWWHDSNGNVVEAENHGEIAYESGEGYMFMDEDVTNAYLGGMEFTGALSTCEENASWYFPIPLSYGGNGPQYGVQRLILELDQPPSFQPTIEFLDHAAEPVELPDLYEDWEPPGGLEEYCEQIPEFCEEEPEPWEVTDEMIWGCVARDIWTGLCPSEPDPKEYPSLTLGCMAYATGCDPDPEPVDTLQAQQSSRSSGGTEFSNKLQLATP